MTQSFTFREPTVSELGQGVLPGANMMPPWNQTAAFDLLPNDGAILEKPGQKRRRELMPPEIRLSNDSVPPTGGNSFCDFGAAHPALAFEKQNFFDRMIHSARSGRFPLTRAGAVSTQDPLDHQQSYNVLDSSATHVARYRSLTQRPGGSLSLESAAAATAQAMANFQALIDEGRRSSSALFHTYTAPPSENGPPQGYHQSHHGYEAASFRATETDFSAGFGDFSPAFGGSTGYMTDGELGDWPNLTCQTSVSNASRSLFESSTTLDLGLEQPQSPCTPQGHQQDMLLSDSHQEYLQHMERMNSLPTDPESPPRPDSSRGRRLSYVEGDHPIFHGLEPGSDFPAEKHVHIYLDPVEVPKHVDDWTSTATYVDDSSPVPEFTSFGDDVQQERLSQSFEPAPVVAPAEPSLGTGMEKFDLNEVPVGWGEAATPKPRKKYHPRVAKDKRTYKRRTDGKKVPASPNVNSPGKRGGKRSSNQAAQCDVTHEGGRDASHPEVVDMDIDMQATSSQHDTALCDCEACIKLRLEKRTLPQSPASPPQRQSWQSTSSPGSSNSPPVRRTLFQPSPQAAPQQDQAGSHEPSTNNPPHGAYSAVKSFFNESALQLGLSTSVYDQQDDLSSAIVPANLPPATHTNNSVMSRLCPRGILAPQKTPFRDMNQVQRIVYLRSILSSSHQLKTSPESLLRHVHDHLPESERTEFNEALWPVVVSDLTDDQEKQLRDFAQLEQQESEPAAGGVIEVVKRRGRVKKPQAVSKSEKPKKRATVVTTPQNGLEMVPYENKSVVPYTGPFNPLRKKKNRAKVVLDDETVRVWKLLMGAKVTGSHESDAEKELKWEEERRKMKAQAQNFIERMHIVIGDRSFSKWKGSVVDSVVGAFLTQNVNDVLSSSAFMSMRSRFPGGGSRKHSGNEPPEETTVAESLERLELQQQPSPHGRPPPSLEVQESYDILAGASSTQPVVLDLQCCQGEESRTSHLVEISNLVAAEVAVVSAPSHGKYNPKTGLTGLERAKLEEKQVTARKDFDFSGLQAEFKPRGQGEEPRPPAPARTDATEDGVDWEAVRSADVAEVADVIKERGLNWILAGRIKAFLERIHLDYGALDLEWLRSMSTDQTKEFLLSIRGLGLKSVECIRLLTLHHLAFPVDTNVGRICVRLGWVPLEPLPEELQLHLLELYPVQATIQKYLWPRLCKFDHKTLYELHYQMISFGKVFCTKTKPNCNACPMRPECKHFASALSSAKLALPASERPSGGPTLALPPGEKSEATSRPVSQYCQPIIEEPMTPESEVDMEDLDIEDYPFSVQELIEDDAITWDACIQDQAPSTAQATAHLLNCCSPYVNVTLPDTEPVPELVPEPLSEPLSEVLPGSPIVEDWGGLAAAASVSRVNEGNTVIEIVDATDELEGLGSASVLVPNAASQEMVVVAPGAASLPVPKLKNVGRLRTVHYVYELPDNHPLLDGLDPRESDDPCTYLLAIWGPGEVPESIPNMNDSVNEENGPFASSSSEGEETIKATLLVPCRTAMRGSFPLNGTYFQVNEVFADHASSLQPMLVPRTLLWNLRRRFVFFGTSVTSIFRGMTAAEIQACFWRGYVCVRGFDGLTKAPKPLVGRLHLQAGKAKGASADA